ncbi:CO or xanthine dehydrogenase, FAD-binding subunit [Peptoclostridium litorale DSM 5388]|uniref:Xanthine dehydrogenase subunit XdhB,FAD-binding n=1 Tax=Peptoclostridium litorale DSM 5388 TaxID=1121324 RepID=A0A069RFF7_PEPLI|nr:FAD binding domain-containing protein [Peptoclostridium litorale]KDR95741.1 xanthine dehydrogenase subunit XdhB,FAD-binding [Peptoclostridium litorale DSM 5388]SIO22240.1 CO or xanthine dehydrogenase, FAD-binding subunit [Peptoclostridium litorale DSM 5388]
MVSIKEYVCPKSIEEAYELLMERKNSAIIGGCAFLRMGSKSIGKGIDLSGLGLDYINEFEDRFEIGAMATLRQIETSEELKGSFGSFFEDSVKNIVGVQLRNIATIGATVFSRYGFSDPITALLALDAQVELHNGGAMSLEEFMENGPRRDILTKIIVNKNCSAASFKMIRNSMADYAIINAAVSKGEYGYRIAVGARPYAASLAKGAMEKLNGANDALSAIDDSAKTAAQELSFSGNMRASQEYRMAVCPVLVKRALMEVVDNG